jgi:hypothetical protein
VTAVGQCGSDGSLDAVKEIISEIGLEFDISKGSGIGGRREVIWK